MKTVFARFARVAIVITASAVLSSCSGGAATKQAAQNAAPPVDVRQKPAAKKESIVSQSIRAVAFSKDNHFLVFCKQRRNNWENIEDHLEVWDIRKRQKLKSWKIGVGVSSLDVSPDNKTFASGYSDKARLWDLQSGKLRRTFELPNGHNPVVAFSSDGRTLVVGDVQKIRVWSVASGRLLRQTKPIIDGAPPFINDLVVSPDDELIVTSAYDICDSIIVYDFKTLKVRWKDSKVDGSGVLISHGGYYTANITNSGIAIYKTRNGRLLRMLGKTETYEAYKPLPNTFAFSSDDKTLIENGGKNALRVWSVATGKLKRTLPGKADAFSRDGKIAVTFDKDNKPQFRSIPIGD
jgi:WD40 repeat protein